jgi:LysM repeat protein
MDHASAIRNEPRICPFLHAVAVDGSLADPIRWPDETNRCTALGDTDPQSFRQQEHACLASAHVICPRFVRGVRLVAEAEPPAAGAGLKLTPAVIAALFVLAAAFALSVGFVVANGGMNLPVAPSGSPEAAVTSAAPSQAPSPYTSGAATAPPTAPPTIEPTAAASIDSATATPTVAPSPTPSAPPSPVPSSDRYALLEPCPDAPGCWIYKVRGGDNLVSIARYFGVPLDTVTELNPWTQTTPLVAGQELRLPPPTR